jgi:hypothetical protein
MVKPFCHAIGWRVKGCDGDVGNAEKRGKLGLRRGRKLGAMIRCECVRNSKTGYPGRTEGMYTNCSGWSRSGWSSFCYCMVGKLTY